MTPRRDDPMLERAEHVDRLVDALRTSTETTTGRMVLVAGEAGIGKTTLVRTFCHGQRETHRVLSGNCDALFTPRALGPFADIAYAVGGQLERLALHGALPHEFALALVAELRRAPTVLVIEDLHWADEASLDVLRLLARRLEPLPLLVLATFRDDEIGRGHSLRIALGEFAANNNVDWLHLDPLSAAAVAALAANRDVDVTSLYNRTGGNPFFVSEVLAATGEAIPATVREAVLARVAQLSPPAREVVDAVAVVPVGCEYWLVDALAPDSASHLDECLDAGVLIADVAKLAFRHELARIAIEAALSPRGRTLLHQRALDVMEQAGSEDYARLAHHAAAAHNADAVARLAPQAALQAAALGAHRQSAAHYASALRFAEAAGTPTARGEWLDRRAYACYLSADFEAAIGAQREAIEHHRAEGDRVSQGRAARLLSLLLRYIGDVDQAWQVGRDAVDLLESGPAGHDLAMAYCNLSHLAAAAEDADECRRWADRAAPLATQLDDVEVQVYLEINLGMIDQISDAVGWRTRLEQALSAALDHGLDELAGRGYVNLTWWSFRTRDYASADQYVGPGLLFCEDRGLDLWRSYLLAYRARASLDRGNWDEALQWAGQALDNPEISPMPRVVALSVSGLVGARRGDRTAARHLDEAWQLAQGTGELQRLEPIAVARAEAFWLAGDHAQAVDATALTLDIARARGSEWIVGEMLSWQRRAGVPVQGTDVVPQPFAAQLAGEAVLAAEHWRRLASPYEAALALGDSAEDADALAAHEALTALGAVAAAAVIARKLRAGGNRNLPRGPRPATRANPAGLTAREVEVLELVAAEMSNEAIANQLSLSRRTVDHHVASILRKLDVPSRRDAATAAERLESP